jgi:hypothetical protein
MNARWSRGLWAPAVLMSILLGGSPARAENNPSASTESTGTSSKFKSPEDGWFDISNFMAGRYGFLPIVIPITEPAVGYGAVGGMAFVDKPIVGADDGYGRPGITFAGGLATENGTWGLMAGDYRYWLDDRLQTLAGALYASINLDYYGSGGKYLPGERSLSYNLETVGGLLQGKFRLGSSRLWGGLQYTYFATNVSFDAPEATPELPDYKSRSDIGACSRP